MADEATKFTWFPKLTDVMQELAQDAPELVGEFALAVTAYGTYNIEPNFSSTILKYAFMGVREDIDNSINARSSNKGGRPAKDKTPGKTPVTKSETPVSDLETPVSDLETPVTDLKTPVTKIETPPLLYTNPYQTKSIPIHTKPRKRKT